MVRYGAPSAPVLATVSLLHARMNSLSHLKRVMRLPGSSDIPIHVLDNAECVEVVSALNLLIKFLKISRRNGGKGTDAKGGKSGNKLRFYRRIKTNFEMEPSICIPV